MVRILARAAGLRDPISTRELIGLLGPTEVGPRPFYVVGHNPNTIEDVLKVLGKGANAIEPDVNVYEHKTGELCVSHDKGEPNAPSLTEYLGQLREVAEQHPQLALVVFDCKTAEPPHGVELLAAVRQYLSGTGLNVIISVPDFESTTLIQPILSELGPREGVMIDEEDDPNAVAAWFTSRGVVHGNYGNGISVLDELLGPNVRPSMEAAVAARAARGDPKFIYVWSVNDEDLLREYVAIGVDGVITDEVAKLRDIVKESKYSSFVRLATRSDNPFLPPNAAYALTVLTGDTSHAGTDANIRITLTGARGISSVTFATWRPGRMEAGTRSYVTLQSPDLGELQSITVEHDDHGNAPSWFLKSIQVESSRYQISRAVTFECWIDVSSPVSRNFRS
ncbi:MAG: PLAT/LH2 domain-containing protein [Polyangiaceae bacterium]